MGWLSGAWDFTKGFGSGAYSAGKGILSGAVDLAKGGYALATDPAARDAAWDATKRTASSVRDYAGEAYEDPSMVWNDVRSAAGDAYTSFDEFRRTADAADWGEAIGGGAVEVATIVVPVTKAAKLGKLGRVANAADEASDLAKKLPNCPPGAKSPCLGTARPAVLNPTKAQLETAGRTGLDPKWIKPNGDIDWPPNNGFMHAPESKTLEAGTVIDRYGSPRGGYLSPEGTPFSERALAPSQQSAKPTRYRVVKPFDVDAGPTASWFDQPGGATQYRLKDASVQDLLDEGYLVKLE